MDFLAQLPTLFRRHAGPFGRLGTTLVGDPLQATLARHVHATSRRATGLRPTARATTWPTTGATARLSRSHTARDCEQKGQCKG